MTFILLSDVSKGFMFLGQSVKKWKSNFWFNGDAKGFGIENIKYIGDTNSNKPFKKLKILWLQHEKKQDGNKSGQMYQFFCVYE